MMCLSDWRSVRHRPQPSGELFLMAFTIWLLCKSICWGATSNSNCAPQRRAASLMAKLSRTDMLYPIITASRSAVIVLLSSLSTNFSLLNSMLRAVASARSFAGQMRNCLWMEMASARPSRNLSRHQSQAKLVLDVSAATQDSLSYATKTKHTACTLFGWDS